MNVCSGCGLEREEFATLVIPAWGKGILRYCRTCRSPRPNMPDIYFKGEYVDEHLASEQYPGPKVIRSRADKQYWLKKCHLREAGDRHHGASTFDPISNRHAMESLRRNNHGKR